MIEPRQIRAARALLNWSQDDLAAASGIARSSIKNIENDITTARKDTIHDIQVALENSGVEFLPGSGVRLKSDLIEIVEGDNASAFLMDTIYKTAKLANDKQVVIFGMDEGYYVQYDSKDLVIEHIKRLKEAGITEKILVCEKDTNYLNDPACYRWVPFEYFEKDAPLYVVGDKVAFQAGNVLKKTIIIHNKQLANHLKKLFKFMWDKAIIPGK